MPSSSPLPASPTMTNCSRARRRPPPTTSPRCARSRARSASAGVAPCTTCRSHLKQGWAAGVNLVQINGGVSLQPAGRHGRDDGRHHRQQSQGQATLLPSPAIFERIATKRAIEADRSVAAVLEMARNRQRLPVQRRSGRHELRARRQRLPNRGRMSASSCARAPSATSSAATSTATATSSTPRSMTAPSASGSTTCAPRASTIAVISGASQTRRRRGRREQRAVQGARHRRRHRQRPPRPVGPPNSQHPRLNNQEHNRPNSEDTS